MMSLIIIMRTNIYWVFLEQTEFSSPSPSRFSPLLYQYLCHLCVTCISTNVISRKSRMRKYSSSVQFAHQLTNFRNVGAACLESDQELALGECFGHPEGPVPQSSVLSHTARGLAFLGPGTKVSHYNNPKCLPLQLNVFRGV